MGFAINDLNSDGNLDIVARTDSGVVIFVNKGIGFGNNMFDRILIQGPDLYMPSTNQATQSITLSDFDNNGKIDILVTGPNSVVILSNYSYGTSLGAVNFPIYKIRTMQRVNPVWKFFSGNITNDNLPDLIFHNYYDSSNDTIFYLKNTFGTTSFSLDSAAFTGPSFLKLFIHPQTTKICDLNSDGKMDVNTVFYSTLGLQNNISATSFSFSPISSITLANVKSFMPIGDLTGDGKIDWSQHGSSSYAL
ncbi:MAG: VCBS repeat-containing protein [Bacteroidia bacterium]|nr:VCBS repeat-containing protein [Bacteroidia bacterium]